MRKSMRSFDPRVAIWFYLSRKYDNSEGSEHSGYSEHSEHSEHSESSEYSVIVIVE